MSDRWSVEELVALLGTSKKQVEISEDGLQTMVDILNGEDGDEEFPLDKIALDCTAGLLASGRYEGAERNAAVVAWTQCVPGFVQGKNTFIQMAPVLMATVQAVVVPAAPDDEA